MRKHYDFVLKLDGKTIFGNCFNDEKGKPELIVPETVFEDKAVRQYTFHFNSKKYLIEADGKTLKDFVSDYFEQKNRLHG